MTAPAAAGASPHRTLHVATDADAAALAASFHRASDLADRLLAPRPEPTTELLGLPESELLEILIAGELEARSLADNTRENYAGHVRAWLAWCRDRGRCPLPAAPADVALHIAGYGVRHDPAAGIARDGDGRLQRAVTPGSVALRLAAIDKLHEYAKEARPGADPGVRRVLQGLRRTFGVRPENARQALDWPRLTACVDAARGETAEQLRWRALLLLRARTGATPGQIAQLDWADVDLYADRVELMLAPARRWDHPRRVLVPAARTAQTCLVTTLRSLHRVRTGDAVLSTTTGKPMSGQGVRHRLKAAAAELGVDVHTAREAVLRDHLILRTSAAGRPAAARDAALLLTGWFAALRRANISALQWRDVTDVAAGELRLLLRFSKNDAEGRGHVVFLPRNDGDPSMCPVTALRAWHRHLAQLLGADPRRSLPTCPVFPWLDRHGRLRLEPQGLPRSLSGDAVNELVQRLAVAADLTSAQENRYGGHSLRVGFVTEAVRRRMTPAEIMAITGHQDPRTMLKYERLENTRENNPARRLLGLMAAGSVG